MEEKLYTLKDIMRMTKLSERTLRRYLREGLIQGKKLKGVWLFKAEDIEAFYNTQDVRKHVDNQTHEHMAKFHAFKSKAESMFVYDLSVNAKRQKEKLVDVIKRLKIEDDSFQLFLSEQKGRVRLFIEGRFESIALCVALMKDAQV